MAKVAIVTGGTRGIGAAIAKALKGTGAAVAATYHGNDEAAAVFKAQTGVATYKWDVADSNASAAGVKQVEADLGPVDILVNNAGITQDSMFHKMSWEQWSRVIRTNLDSMFAMTRPVIEGMRERGRGRIVNISSINGQKGALGQANYAAAKAGIIGFTKSLALESARKGITVNAICPGYIDTDMVANVPPKAMEGILAQIPIGRLGSADEVAALVLYLVSDAAAFMTGAVVSMNGGQYLANG
ncbi:MAG TPA: acetoacetyl-CoA reductase [Bauldia sp.]|nr:acetoacetyl-CoA reductase [Bauldia sp.]